MKLPKLITLTLLLYTTTHAVAYEVAVDLGSTADHSATIAMGDKSKWPVVADLSWGPLANLVPIALIQRSQAQAVFDNFKQRRAISELPYPSVRWNSSQPDIDFIQSFGLTVPYVFVLYEYHERVREQGQATADALKNAGVIDSMLTRDEILRLKARFPGKKIIMNTRSWTRNHVYVESIEDVLDGVAIEFIPQNAPQYVAIDVAPFAAWAHNNDKDLIFLMPPLPDDYLEDRYVSVVKRAAQVIYDTNQNLLPKGWMKSDQFIFAPANYTFGESLLTYVPEDSNNSILAAAKALLMMRPELDAGPVQETPSVTGAIMLLLSD